MRSPATYRTPCMLRQLPLRRKNERWVLAFLDQLTSVSSIRGRLTVYRWYWAQGTMLLVQEEVHTCSNVLRRGSVTLLPKVIFVHCALCTNVLKYCPCGRISSSPWRRRKTAAPC